MTRRILSLVSLLALGACTDSVTLTTPAGPNAATSSEALVYESPEDAQATDIAIAARELDLTEAEVARKLAFQEAFRSFSRSVAERYPDRIAGIWTDAIPAIGGHIVFVGDVPQDVVVDAGWLEILDPSTVELAGGAALSMADGMRHAELAHEALHGEGHTNFLTYFDPASGTVQVEFRRGPGALAPLEAQVSAVVRDRVVLAARLADERLVTLDVPTISDALTVRTRVVSGAGEIFDRQHARGGNLVTGSTSCTSGWTVNGSSGDGFVTAGHCTGINQLQETSGTNNTTTWRSQVWGLSGDVEYHTTNHLELAEFYADASSIRDVTSLWDGEVVSGWPFYYQEGVGDSVCQYGRFSNVRSCNKTVQEVGLTVTFSDGTTTGNLARTDNPTSTSGDSGGGWSWGTKAFGVHTGSSSTDAYFMPVVYVESALNVSILTQ